MLSMPQNTEIRIQYTPVEDIYYLKKMQTIKAKNV